MRRIACHEFGWLERFNLAFVEGELVQDAFVDALEGNGYFLFAHVVLQLAVFDFEFLYLGELGEEFVDIEVDDVALDVVVGQRDEVLVDRVVEYFAVEVVGEDGLARDPELGQVVGGLLLLVGLGERVPELHAEELAVGLGVEEHRQNETHAVGPVVHGDDHHAFLLVAVLLELLLQPLDLAVEVVQDELLERGRPGLEQRVLVLAQEVQP